MAIVQRTRHDNHNKVKDSKTKLSLPFISFSAICLGAIFVENNFLENEFWENFHGGYYYLKLKIMGALSSPFPFFFLVLLFKATLCPSVLFFLKSVNLMFFLTSYLRVHTIDLQVFERSICYIGRICVLQPKNWTKKGVWILERIWRNLVWVFFFNIFVKETKESHYTSHKRVKILNKLEWRYWNEDDIYLIIPGWRVNPSSTIQGCFLKYFIGFEKNLFLNFNCFHWQLWKDYRSP